MGESMKKILKKLKETKVKGGIFFSVIAAGIILTNREVNSLILDLAMTKKKKMYKQQKPSVTGNSAPVLQVRCCTFSQFVQIHTASSPALLRCA